MVFVLKMMAWTIAALEDKVVVAGASDVELVIFVAGASDVELVIFERASQAY